MVCREVRLPQFPECWKTCGSCTQGAVFVLELLVVPGDVVARDDALLTLETGKVALDIPAPFSGVVREIFVAAGDVPQEGDLLLILEETT
ncbi:MAG: dihydrolipoamide acyltransferase [Zoogloeaceae bacterium]|jgi:pyruvate/2-oxoglutarate dehydrogenase complex dihydrolipoamide acyltransferase (E2) component|nr:dihydrolipoamide acyltransferase [Zoogloeaceae bacterium]